MFALELTVQTCLHMVRSDLVTYHPKSLGSGVIIKYKDRYFVCTVAHFTDYPDEHVGVFTGFSREGQTLIYYYGKFDSITAISFEETPDAEDLMYCLENPDRSGNKLDIAFRETTLPDNIKQDYKRFDLGELGTLTIEEGGKSYVVIEDHYEIDTTQLCSFFGRIRPNYQEGMLHYQEKLYWGLPIKSMSEHFIEMDLGKPLEDPTLFRGCSGAPVIDTRGRLVGLVTHGDKDLAKSSIFAYRVDKLLYWIDLMYFRAFIDPPSGSDSM